LIRVRVQHHPSRAHLLPKLLGDLKPLRTEVIEHSSDPPSPWAGYQLCLENIPKCDHLLILQDDVELAKGFVPAVRQIAKAKPDTPVCLFLSRLPRDVSARADRAYKEKQRYVVVPWRSFLPIVAVLWPRHKAVEFAEWTEANPQLPGQRQPRSDDAMGGMWKMRTKQYVLATVPSIVEHPDREPSTVGRMAQWGKDKNRVAHLLAAHADRFDWSQG
jgi:hypothetical protein